MAYSRERFTIDGRRFYEITVSRGRGVPRISRRWYPPEGWSARAIARQLAKEEAALEAAVASGEITTRKEAKAAAEADAAARVQNMTVKEYAEEVFLPRWAESRAASTLEGYGKRLQLYILPNIGGIRVSDLRAADITAMYRSMQRNGSSIGTIRTTAGTLKALLSCAVDDQIIPVSPAGSARLPISRKEEVIQAPASLSFDEVRLLLRQLEKEPPKKALFVRVMLETGIRFGEALALSKDDIGQDGAITITKNAQHTQARGVYIDTPKGKMVRVVYASPETAAALCKLSEENGGGFCFSPDGAQPYHPVYLREYIADLARRTGIPQLHAHALRHTFATTAIINGVDIASVSAALGHSSPAVTLRVYTHASTENARRAAEAVRASLRLGADGDQHEDQSEDQSGSR